MRSKIERLELLKIYQQFGIDEIISESPINRLNEKEISQINETKNNRVILNFDSMSSYAAISKLAQKHHNSQNQDNLSNNTKQNMSENNLVSMAEIIADARKNAENCQNLEGLERAVRNFNGCSLKKMATNTVFSDGNPKSPIMIIGEAPGNHEDLQGIPFCGDSGKLLNEMFAAIGFERQELYITNTLFWRPPGNRRPTEDELSMCRPFVEKHIQLINPKLIILMGATAMSSVLNLDDPISKIRGKFLDYQNCYLSKPVKTICLFHPSYLMRQPNKKKSAWEDLLAIQKFINGLYQINQK